MKIKTSELIGPALNWAVAKCGGVKVRLSPTGFLTYSDRSVPTGPQGRVYEPSTAWSQGGPIIEHLRGNSDHQFLIESDGTNVHVLSWPSAHIHFSGYGPTILIAAMRSYVASKLGDEVEVPEGLL